MLRRRHLGGAQDRTRQHGFSGAQIAFERDRIAGLELGADDSPVKPLALRELLARTRPRLRRNQPTPQLDKLSVADLEIDLPRRQGLG